MVTDDHRVEQLSLLGNEASAESWAQRPEDQWFDRKSGRIHARELGDALVSFANAEGGTIVLGIFDSRVEGTASRGDINAWRQAAFDFTEPPVKHAFSLRKCTNAAGQPDQLVVIDIRSSEHVHTNVKGQTYLRVGDENRRLGPIEAQELRYDKGDSAFDARLTESGLESLDEDLVTRYVAATSAASPETALPARGLFADRDGDPRATTAGLLVLGKNPQLIYPEAWVRVLRYEGRGRETGARANVVGDRRLEGSLVAQIEQAKELITEWLPRAIRLGESGRFEPSTIIPERAWLEAVVNAVSHRSYSLGGDHIRVELFEDRVEVESPGRLPGLVRLENIRSTRFARNPRIARALSDFGYARELGEGVNRMFDEMRVAGLPDPLYRQGPASVQVILQADPLTRRILEHLPAGSDRFAEHLARLGSVTTAEAMQLLSRSRPSTLRYLKKLGAAGLLDRIGGPHDPTAHWRLPRELGE